MRIIVLLLLFISFSFTKEFKIASYNVENLFDSVVNGSEYKSYSKRSGWDFDMVQHKLNNIADVICDLNADILALQEVENENVFKLLLEKLEDVGCKYQYSSITNKLASTIQVALISRYPIKSSKDIVVNYHKSFRNILKAKVNLDGSILNLYVNHWKSRAYNGFESKRFIYAKALEQELNSKEEYILLGDFNTDYDANRFLEKKIDDTNGKTGLHHILNRRFNHKILWHELALDDRYNSKFFGKKGTADHILLPNNMLDGEGIDYVANSFKVFKRSYLFNSKGHINRWQFKNRKHIGKGYSDHLPIYAKFSFEPYVQPKKVLHKYSTDIETIDDLYKVNSLNNEVLLKDVVVVFKNRGNAIIKQTPYGRGIFIYNSAWDLELGKKYDLFVNGLKNYRGLLELTKVYIKNEKANVKLNKFVYKKDFRQNEIVKNIVGIYKDGYLIIGNKNIKIYFKDKKIKVKYGKRLHIHFATIGYFDELQLVVYNKKDLTIKD